MDDLSLVGPLVNLTASSKDSVLLDYHVYGMSLIYWLLLFRY